MLSNDIFVSIVSTLILISSPVYIKYITQYFVNLIKLYVYTLSQNNCLYVEI